MWASTSRRRPYIPTGLRTPSWPSTRKSRGSRWMISRSLPGIAAIRAASTTRETSAAAISRSERETATTPRLFWDAMCSPETATIAPATLIPAMRSALSTASSIACVVASRSTTTPLRTPRDGEVPTPVMWTSPSSSGSAMITQTLVVPMSRPTRGPRFANGCTSGCDYRFDEWCNSPYLQRTEYFSCRSDVNGAVAQKLSRAARGTRGGTHGLHDDAAREAQVNVLDPHPLRSHCVEHVGDLGEAIVDAVRRAHPDGYPVAQI